MCVSIDRTAYLLEDAHSRQFCVRESRQRRQPCIQLQKSLPHRITSAPILHRDRDYDAQIEEHVVFKTHRHKSLILHKRREQSEQGGSHNAEHQAPKALK